MADYTSSKSGPGSLFPDNTSENTWNSVEPLITPGQVKIHHLFGIPLVSAMRDPLTGMAQVMTDDIIKEIIVRAVAIVEADTGLIIFPRQIKEKHPFDKAEFEAFGYFRLQNRPVATIESLSISPSDNATIYNVPLNWIETGYLEQGQINIVPLASGLGYSGMVSGMSTAGGIFLTSLGAHHWIPAFWLIVYTAGFPDGMLPRIVNELIGVVAAMEILSLLGSTYGGSTSHSLSIDSVSQSVSKPGPDIFRLRLETLAEKRKTLTKKLKAAYGLTLFSGNI